MQSSGSTVCVCMGGLLKEGPGVTPYCGWSALGTTIASPVLGALSQWPWHPTGKLAPNIIFLWGVSYKSSALFTP